MPRGNCFIFAWWLYWRRWRGRGYCALRPTRSIKIGRVYIGWHWVFVPWGSSATVHLEPLRHLKPWWRAAVHKLFFEGRIRRYDFPFGEHLTPRRYRARVNLLMRGWHGRYPERHRSKRAAYKRALVVARGGAGAGHGGA